MDKSVLEKRIHDKAEERADRYFEEIRSFILQHKELVATGREGLILKNINGENVPFLRSYGNGGDSLFDDQEGLSKHTNWQEIRKSLVDKYEKEETDNILSKLDSINYLLEGE